jgi:hypothetical protein
MTYFFALFLSVYGITLGQGCTNPGYQIARASKCCVVAPNVCKTSVWNLVYVTLEAPRILRWLREFLKICELLF